MIEGSYFPIIANNQRIEQLFASRFKSNVIINGKRESPALALALAKSRSFLRTLALDP